MKSQTYQTETEEETIALGEKLAAELPPRAVLLLIGQLGAGKTTLAKGIVKGLGAARAEDVSSPTFTLIHEYTPLPHGRGSVGGEPAAANTSRDREGAEAGAVVYHIDLYRLDTPEQVATLGLDEIFDRRAIVLIEWGERFPELMPEDRIEIRLRATGENSREIELRAPERAVQ